CLVRSQTGRSTWWLSIAGLCSGAAFLFRPVYLLLGTALAGFWIVGNARKSIVRTVVPLITPSFLIFVTVVAVQYSRFGYLCLTPKSAFMLFTRTVNVLERIPDDQADLRELLIRHRDRSMIERDSSHRGVSFMWGKDGALNDLLQTTGTPATQLSQQMFNINLGLITHAPLEYLTVVVNDVVDSWFPGATPLAFFGSRVVQLVWTAVHFGLVTLYALSFCSFITAL